MDRNQAAIARYNLGNAHFRKGKAIENNNLDQAIEQVEKSIGQYDQVLKDNAQDEDARYNRDIVQKELERLRKKKKEQEQRKQQQQQQKKDQQQDKQKDNQQEQQQKDQQQNQQNSDQQQDQQKDSQQGQEQKDQQAASAEELSKKEAKALLEDYQRNQEPKGLLNFIPKHRGDQPVAKDW